MPSFVDETNDAAEVVLNAVEEMFDHGLVGHIGGVDFDLTARTYTFIQEPVRPVTLRPTISQLLNAKTDDTAEQ
jgi:hypothetical protein